MKRVTIGAHMLAGREVTTSPVELNEHVRRREERRLTEDQMRWTSC